VLFGLGLVTTICGQGIWVVSHCLQIPFAGTWLLYIISIQTVSIVISGEKRTATYVLTIFVFNYCQNGKESYLSEMSA